MVKVVLACAIVLSFGCGREGYKLSGPNTDAEVCEDSRRCDGDGNWLPPVTLLDGSTDEDAAIDETESDGGVPPGDAGNASDGAQDAEVDSGSGDGAVSGGLPPETLVGRWAVSTAVSKMCNPDVTKTDVVDGPGVFEDDAPFDIEEALDVLWLKALLYENCETAQCQLTRNKRYAFDSFDGETLVAVLEEPQNYRRFVLEIVFSDASTFAGVIATEGLAGFCPCGGVAPCALPLRAVRGVRE